MSTPMSALVLPPLTAVLTNLLNILNKGQAHALANKWEDSSLTAYRLHPDMFPLSRQVGIVCDICKLAVARLAGVEAPKHEDNQVSFAELIARVEEVLAFVSSIVPSALDGTEQKDIAISIRGNPVGFKGLPYLQTFVLPNIYFHSATAYNILRHNGVPVGKMDFLGKIF